MTEGLERALRAATVDDGPAALDGAVLAGIRSEAGRRRRMRLTFRMLRCAAAALAVVLLAVNFRSAGDGADGGEIQVAIDEGDIALDIMGFATPCGFYAED